MSSSVRNHEIGKPKNGKAKGLLEPAVAVSGLVLVEPTGPAWMEEELPQAELEESWARRAEQIARVIETEDEGEQIELALVRLGKEIYGLDVQYIYDIRLLEKITRVPRVPDWVAGVVNLRGRIISALDLKRFLGIAVEASSPEEMNRKLVVVEIPEMELALIVDEVLMVETLPVNKIHEPSSAVRGIPAEYVRGIVVRLAGDRTDVQAPTETEDENSAVEAEDLDAHQNLLTILNLPALLSDKRLVIHEEMM